MNIPQNQQLNIAGVRRSRLSPAADWWKSANCEFDTDDNYVEERIKELKKAGALIAAEIDRLHRLTQPSPSQA